MRVLAGVLGGLLIASPALAATVSPMQGTVSVNRGDGYLPITGSSEISTGDTVMVSPEGRAGVTYADGCRIEIRPGAVVTIGSASPCAAVRMGATRTCGLKDSCPVEESVPRDHYLLAGAVVVGGIAGAIVLLSDDDDSKPASP